MTGRLYWGTTGARWCLPASTSAYPSYLCILSSKTDLLVQEPCKSVMGVICSEQCRIICARHTTNISCLSLLLVECVFLCQPQKCWKIVPAQWHGISISSISLLIMYCDTCITLFFPHLPSITSSSLKLMKIKRRIL